MICDLRGMLFFWREITSYKKCASKALNEWCWIIGRDLTSGFALLRMTNNEVVVIKAGSSYPWLCFATTMVRCFAIT